MKNIFEKITKILPGLVVFIFSFAFVFILLAQPSSAQVAGTPSAADCNNPFSGVYTTQACVELRLGLSEIQSDTIVIPRDPNSVFIVAFRIFLYIAMTIAVGRIVWVGVQLMNVGDDAEKRKELFIQIAYILAAVVLAFGALGGTFLVQNIFFGQSFNDQIIKCSDLPTNASQELKDKCNANVSTQPTATPTSSTRSCTNGVITITIPANQACPNGFF